MKWRLIKSVLLVGSLLGSALTLYLYQVLMQPNDKASSQVVTVSQGSALYPLLKDLEARGLIKDARVARWFAKFSDLENIRAGEFEVPANASPVEVLRLLNSDAVLQYQVTLVEGFRTQDYIQQLKKLPKLRSVIDGWTPEQLLAALDAKEPHIEGLFAPQTYSYTAGSTDIDVLKQAYKLQQDILRTAWSTRAENLPFETPYQALILASVIEKETGQAGERAAIAGVFVRRLQQGMRLQSDPTTIYGLGDGFDGNLTREHLKMVNEYNTYAMFGLPATPIANPGAAAIQAALNPESGSALFFVAKGDGSHQFSDTLDAHNRAVLEYQRFQRRSDYQSSPTSTDSNESR